VGLKPVGDGGGKRWVFVRLAIVVEVGGDDVSVFVVVVFAVFVSVFVSVFVVGFSEEEWLADEA